LTAEDAQMAFMFVLEILEHREEEYFAADCNGDSEVTAGDSQTIFLAALGAASCADPLEMIRPCLQ